MLAVIPPLCGQAHAQGDATLPGGDLGMVLQRYAMQAGCQILFDPALVRGKRVRAMSAKGDSAAVLGRLLRGTGLKARLSGNGLILIERASADRAAQPGKRRAVRDLDPAGGDAPLSRDVVVTALKRPSLVHETPGMIRVFHGGELEDRGIMGLQDLGRTAPGLAVIDTRTGEQRVVIRGIYGTGEATVGVYYGETPVTGPSGTTFDPGGAAPDIALVDVDRIELLHGPQGTLYGASSLGGTLRVLFNQPDGSQWSGMASGGVLFAEGGTLGHDLTAVLNAPVVKDRLAVRVVAYRRQDPAFVDKPALGLSDIGGVTRRGERIGLAWTPSEDVRITGTYLSHRLHLDDSPTWQAGAGRYVNDETVRTPYSSRLRLANLTGQMEMDGKTVLLTLSRYRWSLLRQNDFTSVLSGARASFEGCGRLYGLAPDQGCDAAQLTGYGLYVDSRLPALLYQPMTVRSVSGEFRVSSDSKAALRWTAGFFMENRRDGTASYVVRADAGTGYAIQPLDITGLRTIDATLRQRAFFGEVSYRFAERWSATFGARRFHYRRRATGVVVFPNIITGTGNLEEGFYETRESGSSLKAELSYHPSADLLLYMRAAQGFRPGGVNITPSLSDAERSYHSDRLWSFELGMKLQVKGRGGLQAAAYHIDWDDMIYYTSSANGAFSYNRNIGPVVVNGLELEADWLVTRRLSAFGRMSYTDARLSGSGLLPLGGRAGDRLPDISPFTFALGASWRKPLGDRLEGVFRLEAHGASGAATRFNSAIAHYERLPSHILTDFSAGVGDGKWDTALIIRNLFNGLGATRITSSAYSAPEFYGNRPRNYELRLSRSF